jgi:uncharacterized protein YceK
MNKPVLLLLCATLFSGCATSRHSSEAEQRAYVRGYQRAVQEQYWIIQNQQRLPSQGAGSASATKP